MSATGVTPQFDMASAKSLPNGYRIVKRRRCNFPSPCWIVLGYKVGPVQPFVVWKVNEIGQTIDSGDYFRPESFDRAFDLYENCGG